MAAKPKEMTFDMKELAPNTLALLTYFKEEDAVQAWGSFLDFEVGLPLDYPEKLELVIRFPETISYEALINKTVRGYSFIKEHKLLGDSFTIDCLSFKDPSSTSHVEVRLVKTHSVDSKCLLNLETGVIRSEFDMHSNPLSKACVSPKFHELLLLLKKDGAVQVWGPTVDSEIEKQSPTNKGIFVSFSSHDYKNEMAMDQKAGRIHSFIFVKDLIKGPFVIETEYGTYPFSKDDRTDVTRIIFMNDNLFEPVTQKYRIELFSMTLLERGREKVKITAFEPHVESCSESRLISKPKAIEISYSYRLRDVLLQRLSTSQDLSHLEDFMKRYYVESNATTREQIFTILMTKIEVCDESEIKKYFTLVDYFK